MKIIVTLVTFCFFFVSSLQSQEISSGFHDFLDSVNEACYLRYKVDSIRVDQSSPARVVITTMDVDGSVRENTIPIPDDYFFKTNSLLKFNDNLDCYLGVLVSKSGGRTAVYSNPFKIPPSRLRAVSVSVDLAGKSIVIVVPGGNIPFSAVSFSRLAVFSGVSSNSGIENGDPISFFSVHETREMPDLNYRIVICLGSESDIRRAKIIKAWGHNFDVPQLESVRP